MEEFWHLHAKNALLGARRICKAQRPLHPQHCDMRRYIPILAWSMSASVLGCVLITLPKRQSSVKYSI